jgi:hypothetical protein
VIEDVQHVIENPPNSPDEMFSQLTGECWLCGAEVHTRDEQLEHFEHHRQRWRRDVLRVEQEHELWEQLSDWRSDPYISRRLGVETIWKQLDEGKGAEQIIRDLAARPHTDVPVEVVRWAAALPEGPWTKGWDGSKRPATREAVMRLHRQGFLTAEIADRLSVKLAEVDRLLKHGGADWDRWLERCCFPGWGSAPLF